jgi:hypothetical protein
MPVGLSTGATDALMIARDAAAEEYKAWPILGQIVWEAEDLSGDAGVKRWIAQRVPLAEQRTTVFGFLGHHDHSSFFFNRAKGQFSVAEVERSFKEPSVAILNACDVSMENMAESTMLGRLMKNGMSTIVTTTSKVSGPLAAAYLTCMRRVLEKKQSVSVADLHYYVTQCMWSDSPENPWNTSFRFAHGALKYQVFGNPDTLLCYPAAPPVSATAQVIAR